ncbi:MAG: elongation factor G [Clostridia bacterium]|nr:elongation factor G [Clostridia bacterium]
MKSSDLRNIVLLGHGGTGKTSIAEAMLFNAKATDRLGRVADGNTVCDFDAEETNRQFSINMALAPYNWENSKINILDTPGYFDFEGEMHEAISVADAAIIVVAGNVAVGAEKAWDEAEKRKLPRAFFINKMNEDTADFNKIYDEIKEKFGKSCIALHLPIRENNQLIGFVSTISKKAYHYDAKGNKEVPLPAELQDIVEQLHMDVCEHVAESSDELMEKFFAGEEFTDSEVREGLKSAINKAICAPVLIGSAYENLGIRQLSDFIVKYMPSPLDRGPIVVKDVDGNDMELPLDAESNRVAFVFKTIVDPFVGRLTLFKVYSGTFRADAGIYNVTQNQEERISQLFMLRGKKQIPVDEVIAGDIGCVAKLVITRTNHTIGSKSLKVICPQIKFPVQQISLGIAPKARGDEEKIATSLNKLRDEDHTFKFETNVETGQTLISGMGEQHIDIIVSKLKSRYSVSVDLSDPKIAYREAIRKKVTTEGLHKKQSGGAGQYGKVVIEFEPGEQDGLEFCERVFGGAVPKQFFPSVEKGLQESIKKGILAGYPMANLKATLIDGKYHPVDSKEVAFVSAARIAYKAAMKIASPTLLEPVYQMNVYVPEKYMGDIIGDMNKRRGRVLGMNHFVTETGKSLQEIVAEVPYAEIFRYAVDLRAMTRGRGFFTTEFVRYEDVPEMIAQKIIENAKKDMEDDED